jgi:uncharacterized protein YecE (DUF72 family)
VYPASPPRGFSPVEYLSGFFDTLEINTSFYGPPKAETARKWNLYSFRELEPWADRVRTISEKRRESVFVVTNNHFQGKAVVNALQLTALLMDRPVNPPEQLLMRYPELRDISENK